MFDDLTESLAGARRPGQGAQRAGWGSTPRRSRACGRPWANAGRWPSRSSRARGRTPSEAGVAEGGGDGGRVACRAGGGGSFVGQQVASRAQVYQQLAQAAAMLQQLEPHSPIPYLINRAVELGALSFPDLMRQLIRDADVLAGDESRAGDQGAGGVSRPSGPARISAGSPRSQTARGAGVEEVGWPGEGPAEASRAGQTSLAAGRTTTRVRGPRPVGDDRIGPEPSIGINVPSRGSIDSGRSGDLPRMFRRFAGFLDIMIAGGPGRPYPARCRMLAG